jgi:hypothetical protein
VNPAKLIAVLAADACRCLREPADRFGHQTQHGRQVSLAVVTSDVSVGGLQSIPALIHGTHRRLSQDFPKQEKVKKAKNEKGGA